MHVYVYRIRGAYGQKHMREQACRRSRSGQEKGQPPARVFVSSDRGLGGLRPLKGDRGAEDGRVGGFARPRAHQSRWRPDETANAEMKASPLDSAMSTRPLAEGPQILEGAHKVGEEWAALS